MAAGKIVADIRRQTAGIRLSPADYVGILLVDGLALGETVVRELTASPDLPIPIIGGTAADELSFSETYVSWNGQVSGDAAVLMVMRLEVPFHYDHYVHYTPTPRSFVVSEADPSQRTIWQLDGRSGPVSP